MPKPGAVVAGARPKARGDARNIRRQLIREADVGPGEEQVIGRKTAS